MKTKLLDIKNLHVSVQTESLNNPVLCGLDLGVGSGEIHAIMGPNGSGKSTLAHLLARKPGYTVTQGSIDFLGEDLLTLSPEACACKGLFLGFQYPVAIPGLSNVQFLKASLNALRASQGKPPIDAVDCLSLIREKMALLEIPDTFMSRSLNEGFSGGEKKRNEILQMLVLEPTLVILDEIDSGLDIDALKTISKGINALRAQNRSIILITHYQRLLESVEPDFVHVLSAGKIVQSGGKDLANALEISGYVGIEGASRVS